MSYCKKTLIAAFTIAWLFPLSLWSEAPVVDDSGNFAMEMQQGASSSAANSKYGDPALNRAQIASAQNNRYPSDRDDEAPLVQEDNVSQTTGSTGDDNAGLLGKVQSLRQEIQELRGQLEVQAHDLKLLQQQQVAYYKDLDARLTAAPIKGSTAKLSKDMAAAPKPTAAATTPTAALPVHPALIKKHGPVSHVNLADEQIRYLAAYELVKNKRFDDAVRAMESFVQNYPEGGYTANAEYWLGELYLLKKDYAKSIQHFEIVLQQFPASSKAAACMLKGGYAYAAAGDSRSAKKLFEQVIATYPNTTTAQLASSKLASFNAS